MPRQLDRIYSPKTLSFLSLIDVVLKTKNIDELWSSTIERNVDLMWRRTDILHENMLVKLERLDNMHIRVENSIPQFSWTSFLNMVESFFQRFDCPFAKLADYHPEKRSITHHPLVMQRWSDYKKETSHLFSRYEGWRAENKGTFRETREFFFRKITHVFCFY